MLSCACGLASAQPSEPPADPPADLVSGITHEDATPVTEHLRWIPRVLLFVPRWAFWVVVQPIRLGAWAYERYNLSYRVRGAFFNVDQTYGMYPVASVSSDFGVSVGARVVHHNLFGHHENLKLRANFGGQFRQAYGIELRSGERVADRFSAGVEARFERRPNERFFGIGNGDLAAMPAAPIDPTMSDAAVSSRFREDITRVVPSLDVKLVGPLSARASGALALRSFANGGTEPIEANYDTTKLVGYDGGLQNVYLEGELIYDTRRSTSPFQSQVIDTDGWYVQAYVGRAIGIRTDPTAFTRYGGQAQHFFDLYRGSRSLALRVVLDSTAGSDGLTDGKLSFVDLPRLGGSDTLRGYPSDRFRDRVATLASAEYTWDLGNFLAGYLFVDAGRVWHAVRDIRLDVDGLRVGFGGGVQVHTYQSFLTRIQLAFSREGDLLFELALTPSFGRRERAGRY